MKRNISILLVALMLLTCLLPTISGAQAAEKAQESRAIAIVFDNSWSMYMGGNKAWCRATYAMEVFASMLNAGDVLQIYPMHAITVDGQTYSMESPLQITDAAQASKIRNIYTEYADGTPIDSIDCAASGLRAIRADKKYMIVLTDGGTFSKDKDSKEWSEAQTKKELDDRIQTYAGPEMMVMYLGVGSAACMPSSSESEFFIKKQAVNSQDVLSTLTVMCNRIFGRDALPEGNVSLSNNTIEFDISMKKLIVFVQGTNISDLSVGDGSVGKLENTQQTKYSTLGTGRGQYVWDESLQGMIVTYADCAAGNYTISYTGTATSIEVYFEPDVDLNFVFTDAEGNNVDPNALYEGDYKVSFGMKDARTGELVSSDLLGSPLYQGSYYINGNEFPIGSEDAKGIDIPLKMGDTFEANLTVTYLSGYTISKSSADFGWPQGGIKVAPRPAGDLRLEISGGDDVYYLQTLEEGKPYIAKVYYKDEQLTGSELEKTELKWEPETSNVEIKKEFADDHWILSLHYKDPSDPQATQCGECTVSIYAFYCEQGSDEAQTQGFLTYYVEDDFSPLQMELYVPEDYIIIKDIEKSQAMVATLTLNGTPLTAEDFAATQLQVDCGGIEYAVTDKPEESTYLIKLMPTAGLEEGDYQIKVSAVYTDLIGRETKAADSKTVTFSTLPVWVKWALGLLLLLIVIFIIWKILHIRVLPRYMHTTKKLSSMNFDGTDETQATKFHAEIKKKSARVQAQYGGRKFGISMDVTPGNESYLYKSQKGKSAKVKVTTVRKFGPAKIHEALIGSTKYVADENGKLVPALPNQKPFLLTNGMMVKYSGTIQDAGIEKDFEVTSKLNFKKKK